MIRLFRFLGRYTPVILVIFALVFLQSIGNLYLPTLTADITNNGILKNDTAYIWREGGYMLLITLGGAICAIGSAYLGARVAVGFGRRVRATLFTHVEQFSLHEFDTMGAASLITRTTNDTNQVQNVLVIMLTMMVSAPMTAIGGIYEAVQQDASLAWILVVAVPILVVAIL